MLESPKERYSMSNREAVMRWQEGHNHNKIKLPQPPGRWPSNWRTIIPKKFPHSRESSRPRSGFPAWGSRKWTRRSQGIWHWRPEGSDCRTSTGLGKQRLGSWRAQTKPVFTRTEDKGAVTPQDIEPHLPGSIWGSPEVWVGRGSLRGRGHWRWQTSEVLLGSLSPLGSHHQPYHRPCRLQGWVTLGQTTNREGVQPHPRADNCIKGLLSRLCPPEQVPDISTASPSHQKFAESS